jgi:hypothetical protein
MREGVGATWRRGVVLAVATALACGRGDGKSAGGAGGATAAINRDSARAASAAESVAVARDEWNKAEVVRRLAEAGLVVIDAKQKARRPEMHVEGDALQVSGADLEIYVYGDAEARRRDSEALDTVVRGIPTPDRPRYIISGNLIAVLRTPNERLAERVENALTARHTGEAQS